MRKFIGSLLTAMIIFTLAGNFIFDEGWEYPDLIEDELAVDADYNWIGWESSNENVIATDGTAIRPPFLKLWEKMWL